MARGKNSRTTPAPQIIKVHLERHTHHLSTLRKLTICPYYERWQDNWELAPRSEPVPLPALESYDGGGFLNPSFKMES